MLKAISSIIRGVLPYSREKLIRVKGSSRALYEHHVKIIQAIEARDGALAKKLVIQHVNYLEKSLRKVIK
jgi:DNA-binding GntR family transcriptional regulator